MKEKYIISLSDSDGHYHLLATDINSEEEKEELEFSLKMWHPVSSLSGKGKKIILEKDILDSLENLTGHTFYTFEPNYSRRFSGKRLLLPWLD